MGKHTLNTEPPTHCERSEYCDQGYRHFGPCPSPPESVDEKKGRGKASREDRKPATPEEVR